MKYVEKLRAIDLREQGKSYSEIIKEIEVSKGTLSIWLRDVPLTEKQRTRLHVTLRQQNVYRLAKKSRQKKAIEQRRIAQLAMKEARTLLINDPLFVIGTMLYWAEGDKSKQHEAVKFSNSDPNMIKIVMRWFREICCVKEQKFRIAIHIHELHNRKQIETYWSNITGIPKSQFHKTWIKPTSLGHRKNKLYNGTCSIRISDKNLFRRIQGWKEGIIEEMEKIS